jgi:small redox-active disulfide protein 2
MKIKVLGTGCAKCKLLEQRVREMTEKNKITAEIEKVTQLDDIMSYGVMLTPGLVINEELRVSGKVPSEADILKWLKEL